MNTIFFLKNLAKIMFMEIMFVIRAGQLCCLLISGRFTRHLVPVISVSVHWSGVVLGEPSLSLWAWIAMFWDSKILFLGIFLL